ncbi:hypothetical protein MRX96_047971 [Rhipicephalus microplus]
MAGVVYVAATAASLSAASREGCARALATPVTVRRCSEAHRLPTLGPPYPASPVRNVSGLDGAGNPRHPLSWTLLERVEMLRQRGYSATHQLCIAVI